MLTRDAHGQVDAVAAAQLLAVGGDRRLDRERRAHRALGVVLVPDGGAEEREQAVAVNCATVPSKRRTSPAISATISSNRNLERSGPSRSPIAVEPTTSANSTVTMRWVPVLATTATSYSSRPRTACTGPAPFARG